MSYTCTKTRTQRNSIHRVHQWGHTCTEPVSSTACWWRRRTVTDWLWWALLLNRNTLDVWVLFLRLQWKHLHSKHQIWSDSSSVAKVLFVKMAEHQLKSFPPTTIWLDRCVPATKIWLDRSIPTATIWLDRCVFELVTQAFYSHDYLGHFLWYD